MVEEESPSGLVVVSSDRRVQAAARRRRAIAVDSDEWLAGKRRAMNERVRQKETKPTEPGPGDVEAMEAIFWSLGYIDESLSVSLPHRANLRSRVDRSIPKSFAAFVLLPPVHSSVASM